MRKGEKTKNRILDIAEHAILQKGFGATSIEEIIAEAEITKSGFFYHFRDKSELAHALLERHIERDEEVLDQIFTRGFELSDDPLQAFLIGLNLFAEMMADLPAGHPGCLVATYCYQEQLFDRQVTALNRAAVLAWRARFRPLLERIAEIYPPRDNVDLDEVADFISTVVEGAIVMAKVLGEPEKLPQQILLLRSYMKVLFRFEPHLAGYPRNH